MTTNNQPASAAIEPEKEQPLDDAKLKQDAPPASEPPVEEWDKERAAATIKAQRAEEKRLREQLKDYERLKAEEDKRIEAQMTEADRLKKQASDLAKENAKLQADILRRDVIAETGLPAVFADRLKGATKEELLADAEEIKKLLPQTQQKPKQAVTNPGGASQTETDAEQRERLFGKSGSVFDPKTIKELGGGVVWKKQE